MNMQPTDAARDGTVDIAATIAMTMRQMGVIGLPRNYEIFYEALNGTNQQLSIDLVSLGKRPKQDELDKIGHKYFAQHHAHGFVDAVRENISKELEEITKILVNERNYLEKYGRILDQTSEGLNNRQLITKDLLQKIVGVMATATTSTIDHGKQAVTFLGDKSAELENVKSKLEEYKKLADTDSLTHIWNRRAFDRQIAKIYDTPKGVMFSALVLADIDRFKEINDRYGHPVGDKILQIIAAIFQSSTRQGMFVARTGGEEFALIIEGSSEDATFQFADNIRKTIFDTPFVNPETGANYGPISVSMGVCMASDADGPDDLYAKADRALYRSKVNGRNQVSRYSAAPDSRGGKNWMLYKKD